MNHRHGNRRTIGHAPFVLTCVLMASFCLGTIAARDSGKVYVVPISGEVDFGMYAAVNRLITRAQEDDTALVLLEIDTPGGRVDICFDICEKIQSMKKAETIAYVTTEATSAGSIISIACDHIYMKPATTIGSAAPIILTASGAEGLKDEEVREKHLSYLRSRVSALAEENGHSASLAMAMVDRSLEVVEVTVDGVRQYVTTEKLSQLQSRDHDVEAGPSVISAGKLLNLTAKQAERYRLSAGTFDTREALLAHLHLQDAEIIEGHINWSEKLVRFLTSPLIQSLLFILGALGIYTELKVPGFGLPGMLGIACFVLFFWSHYLAGLAEWVEIALVMIGFLLIALEMFVIPGFGITGIAGLLCVAIGIILSLQGFGIPDPKIPWEMGYFMNNLLVTMSSAVTLICLVMLLAKFMPGIPMLNKLVHSTVASSEEGYRGHTKDYQVFMNHTGTARTPLRPSGKAEIQGHLMHVTSRGEFLEPGTPVKVIEVSGNRVVVEKDTT